LEKEEEYTECPKCGHKFKAENGCDNCARIVILQKDLNLALELQTTLEKRIEYLTEHNEFFTEEIRSLRERDKAWYITMLNMKKDFLSFLTTTIDRKDSYTGSHSVLVENCAGVLADILGYSEKKKKHIMLCGRSHDVGKIDIPEIILRKPGKLTDKERDIINQHPQKGVEICRDVTYLIPTLDAVLYHHERWDGKGYPRGLKGDRIPEDARLICLADTAMSLWDTRPYRKAWTIKAIFQEIENCAGTQFDPDMVEKLLKHKNRDLIFLAGSP
jgi:HD-GYP domain-containing protein (c-di-GMP phosphodiesterase class II)